jgi:hypothetical protein
MEAKSYQIVKSKNKIIFYTFINATYFVIVCLQRAFEKLHLPFTVRIQALPDLQRGCAKLEHSPSPSVGLTEPSMSSPMFSMHGLLLVNNNVINSQRPRSKKDPSN